MSRCLNKATLIGYLGADPEIRTTTSGSRVAHLSLATTRRWNDREGQAQEKTQWPLCRATQKPLSDHSLREKFRALEEIAGVEHKEGRALYGLRRQATDLAPEFAQDAQVLNRISGHSDSATRERIYQDPQNDRVRARAAEARRSMRAFLTEAKTA